MVASTRYFFSLITYITFALILIKSGANSDEGSLIEEQCSAGDVGSESCGCNLSRDSITTESALESILEDTTATTAIPKPSYEPIRDVVLIPEGLGYVGTNNPKMMRDGESPKREVFLSAYFIDKFEVSNEGLHQNLHFTPIILNKPFVNKSLQHSIYLLRIPDI